MSAIWRLLRPRLLKSSSWTSLLLTRTIPSALLGLDVMSGSMLCLPNTHRTLRNPGWLVLRLAAGEPVSGHLSLSQAVCHVNIVRSPPPDHSIPAQVRLYHHTVAGFVQPDLLDNCGIQAYAAEGTCAAAQNQHTSQDSAYGPHRAQPVQAATCRSRPSTLRSGSTAGRQHCPIPGVGALLESAY